MFCGALATMPPKMMIETPLPMPLSVISSPSHTASIVPAVILSNDGYGHQRVIADAKAHVGEHALVAEQDALRIRLQSRQRDGQKVHVQIHLLLALHRPLWPAPPAAE